MRCLLCAVAFFGAMIVPCAVEGAPVFALAFLDGPSENPANASPGSGFATVSFDIVAHLLSVDVSFMDLLGPTTAAHIHGPAVAPANASVITATPTFPGFPLGVTSGAYSMVFDTLDTATYRAGFVTDNGGTAAGAEVAFFNAFTSGQTYFNIHTTSFPGGEIRGFLQ
ncbi:MAG: CHRD domain-containing protein, partial [Planctomycetaceae bacterium]